MASHDDITTFFTQAEDKKNGKASKNGEAVQGNGEAKKPRQKRAMNFGIRTVDSDEKLLNTFERMYSSQGAKETDVEEVWFAGCHCDIGGGSVSNKTRHSLARISLRWMVREIFKAKTGILFLSDRLFEIGMDPATVYPEVKHPSKEIPIRPRAFLSKKKSAVKEAPKPPAHTSAQFLGSEEEEELLDALSPIYDQLKIKWSWWILELIPLNMRYQGSDDKWVNEFGINHAKPRHIPEQNDNLDNVVKVHRSVQTRMQAEYEDEKKRRKGKHYQPRASIHGKPIWID
ncbi:hypothetical protein NMY22_g17855 [Coprinellus aureogranulatus]|nr:hypothetical protein NMY22_g17855 [Coprinellus aureogranulatus]